jgi:hypothetical protein
MRCDCGRCLIERTTTIFVSSQKIRRFDQGAELRCCRPLRCPGQGTRPVTRRNHIAGKPLVAHRHRPGSRNGVSRDLFGYWTYGDRQESITLSCFKPLIHLRRDLKSDRQRRACYDV